MECDKHDIRATLETTWGLQWEFLSLGRIMVRDVINQLSKKGKMIFTIKIYVRHSLMNETR